MTNRLLFVTSNRGKVVRPTQILAEYGIEVVWHPLSDVPELQAEDSSGVVRDKAKWVWRNHGGGDPIMVADSSFHVDALNGWPGANVKWCTRDLGLDGYLRLMSPWPEAADRTCHFLDSIACVRAGEGDSVDCRVFERLIRGRLATSIGKSANQAVPVSALWGLFVPDGFDVTIAEMDDKTLRQLRSRPDTSKAYSDLGRWLSGESI